MEPDEKKKILESLVVYYGTADLDEDARVLFDPPVAREELQALLETLATDMNSAAALGRCARSLAAGSFPPRPEFGAGGFESC